MEINFKCPLTAEELQTAHNVMLDSIADWVAARYPKIRLDTVEKNLAAFLEIKKYDDACKVCMGTGQCPTMDGNRMNGRLDADGVVTIWMEGCPQGHKIPKRQSEEKTEVKRWEKTGR